MADADRLKLRGLWFQIHKWIGLLLVLLLIPLSVTGSALVWHDWLDEAINPARHAVSGKPVAATPAAYAAAARTALPGGPPISQLRLEHDGPVIVTAVEKAASGPPQRTMVWLDPADGRVLDVADGNDGLVRWLHRFHGSLTIPGVGRQIVGWLGVAMLLSCLTGLWLWWPAIGSWTRGFRWSSARDFETNLHHQTGFWIALPLAMLSFTGVWISFPPFFAALSGTSAEVREAARERSQRARAQPLEQTMLSPDAALAAATGAYGGKLVSITWPTDMAPSWRVSLARPDGGTANILVNDSTGEAEAAKDAAAQGGIARLMRRLHDGTGMGAAWQIVIFIGGILPAVLGVTGVIMWLRTRGWRGEVARRQGRGAVKSA
jgi:uncharacterized iron-regulated membrane protein